jgi:glycerol-3-phosphate dehydrogenase
VDDARLTLSVARAAHESGATVLTYAAVTHLCATPGKLAVADVVDRLSDRTCRVQACVIVNATGPWSDHVRRLADPKAPPRLRTTKGVHILVRRERLGNRGAVIFRSGVDGRVMFILPWGEFTYVGTTDTEYDGNPVEATADSRDIRYLLDSANGIFPDAALQEEDVISTWAGIRPLLAPTALTDVSASATSREHAIWRDPSGLLNVAGGKLTTFRSMAAEVADHVATILRQEFGRSSGTCFTEFIPLPGAPEEAEEALIDRLRGTEAALLLKASDIEHLVRRYGADAEAILALISENPSLAGRLVEERPYFWAEAIHAVRHEMAMTLDDILRRRLHLCYELNDGGLSVARSVAELVCEETGLEWGLDDIERQIESYAAIVHTTRGPLRPAGPSATQRHQHPDKGGRNG